MRTPRTAAIAVLVGLVALFGAIACGDDDDTAADTGGATTTAAPATTDGATTPTTPGGETIAITDGTTTLQLSGAVSTVLDTAGVEVTGVAPASDTDQGIAFPITGGSVTTEPLGGTIDHEGALRFSALGQSLELQSPQIDLADGRLTAEAPGGRRIPILNLGIDAQDVQVDGAAVTIDAAAGTLTGDAAQALNDTLGVDVFDEGLSLADVMVDAQG